MDKHIVEAALKHYLEHLQSKPTDLGCLLKSKLVMDELEQMNVRCNSHDLLHSVGGEWLGVVHEWIQRKFVNGEQVTWGSEDVLNPNTRFTVGDYERLASKIACAAINEHKGK